MLLWVLIFGVLGARIYHVIDKWTVFYSANPGLILQVWNGGLGIPRRDHRRCRGALFVYTRVKGLPTGRWLDIFAMAVPLGQAIGRLGNFVNQELYGPPTDLPWGIPIDAAHRIGEWTNLNLFPVATTRFHPLFAYEAIASLLTLGAMLWISRRFADRLYDGDMLLIFIMFYGVSRSYLETFRVQNWVIAGIPTATWLGIGGFLLAGGFLWLRHAKGWGTPFDQPRPPATEAPVADPARRTACRGSADRAGILPDVTAAIGGTPLVALDRLAAGLDHARGCQARAHEPRRLGQGPHRPADDRGCRACRAAQARRRDRGADQRQHRRRAGDGGRGQGYRCIFVMADKQSEEKRALLRAYGAEVVICPTDVDPEDERSYYRVSDRLARETPGAWKPDQYSNPANPEAHFLTTGPEIWDVTEGRVTHFVAGIGTGGTISGVGRYLRSGIEPGGDRGPTPTGASSPVAWRTHT